MTENFTGMLNRNFGMSYGDEGISRNSTGKMASISIHSLEGKGEDEELNGNLWNHEGINLGEKFGAEMLDFDTPWDWIQDRINREDWTGINVGDYIKADTKNNSIYFKAYICGINTYKNVQGIGNHKIESHIDFLFRMYNKSDDSIFNVNHRMNTGNANNSLDASTSAYKSMEMYYYLNGLSGSVRGQADIETVNFVGSGFIDTYIPDDLREIIAERESMLPVRFTNATTLTTNDSGRVIESIGKLWLFDEFELIGSGLMTSTVSAQTASYSEQYPLFLGSREQYAAIFSNVNSYTRTPAAGSSAYFNIVSGAYANIGSAGNPAGVVPGFRISKNN